jgi:hypothetical protein
VASGGAVVFEKAFVAEHLDDALGELIQGFGLAFGGEAEGDLGVELGGGLVEPGERPFLG